MADTATDNRDSNRRPTLRGRRRVYSRPLQEVALSAWILVPICVLFGTIITSQFVQLNPRYLKLLFGVVAVITVIRLPFPSAVTLFVLVFTVPTFVFVSDTNVLLIGLLLTAWSTLIVLGRVPKPERSPVDWAIWAYLGIHLLSFVNVTDPVALQKGIPIFVYMASGAALYWLLYNAIRTREQIWRVLQVLCLVSGFAYFSALVEYFFNYKVVPEWFLYRGGQTITSAERVGGIFGYHALLADFSAIMFYLQVFMGMRSRGTLLKVVYYGLAAIGLVVISMTVNRGGALTWAIGGAYFLFLARRQVDWTKLLISAPIVATIFLTYRWVVGQEPGRIRLIARLAGTQIERGIPDTRVHAWTQVLRRIPEHPWIGHGPYYQLGGVGESKLVWPHSAYLFYLYSTGVFGLMSWLWILGKLLWKTFPGFQVDFRTAPFGKAVMALAHIQVVMFAMAQLRASHQRGNVYLYLMWILFALAAISWRYWQQQKAGQTDESEDIDVLDPPVDAAARVVGGDGFVARAVGLPDVLPDGQKRRPTPESGHWLRGGAAGGTEGREEDESPPEKRRRPSLWDPPSSD